MEGMIQVMIMSIIDTNYVKGSLTVMVNSRNLWGGGGSGARWDHACDAPADCFVGHHTDEVWSRGFNPYSVGIDFCRLKSIPTL